MTVTSDDLRCDLVTAFARAREELLDARRRHQAKDSPDNRSAVRQRLAQIDQVLDFYLEMRPAARR